MKFEQDISQLKSICDRIKRRFLEMYHEAGSGHVGSSLSCLDILTFIRFSAMQSGDELILSKGHAAAALYSTLIESHDIPASFSKSFYKNGTHLAGHPPPGKLPGIRFATGSLGHGLGLSAGLAKSWKMRNRTNRVFCVCSDGEINEGSFWEALMFGSQHNLNNLVCFVDRNHLQGFGRTEDVLDLKDLGKKLELFDWNVHLADGHSFQSMDEAAQIMRGSQNSKPTVFVCETIKGKGYLELENTVDCHYLPMTDEQYSLMCKE